MLNNLRNETLPPINIGRDDVYWNYVATFLKIASSALLLPLILRIMPSETVGIWAIFMTVSSFASLLDFGFSGSFTRNVTYVFSGVNTLKAEGIETIVTNNPSIDYGLLKRLIMAMRWVYLRMSIILFFILITLGTLYIHLLLQNYKGISKEVYIAWLILCIINTYNIYTLYFDALLQGKGLIKRSKQIIIVGQVVYLIVALILIFQGFGLIAIVSAQASSVIIIRWLSYHSFFDNKIKIKLHQTTSIQKNDILKAIYPNAIKIGLTSFGRFLVQRSSIIIGSLYLTLDEVASYGITMQLIGIIAGLAGIYTATYQSKISQLRVLEKYLEIKEIYLKGEFLLIITYVIGGFSLLFLGKWSINQIGSQTSLMPTILTFLAICISFLENNHAIAGGILLTKNEVPFFKASILAGLITLLLLFILFHFTKIGIMGMIIAPGIAHLYNNWKWPYEVKKQLNISFNDVKIFHTNIKHNSWSTKKL